MQTESNYSNPTLARQRRPYAKKRWKGAHATYGNEHLKYYNPLVETAYMNLLTKVKALYATKQEYVFERDLKENDNHNCTSMHSFLTSSLVLELECGLLDYKLYVHYDFDNCPFEQEIRKLLDAYPFKRAALHSPKEQGVAAYFKAVVAFQGKQHCNYLQPHP
jgi:hypothetical protein